MSTTFWGTVEFVFGLKIPKAHRRQPATSRGKPRARHSGGPFEAGWLELFRSISCNLASFKESLDESGTLLTEIQNPLSSCANTCGKRSKLCNVHLSRIWTHTHEFPFTLAFFREFVYTDDTGVWVHVSCGIRMTGVCSKRLTRFPRPEELQTAQTEIPLQEAVLC